MYSFDASSVIKLWDDYPISNPVFEPLWKKFKDNINSGEFVISDISILQKENSDLIKAQQIHDLLNIIEDNYGAGVGENDIFIIAIAKRTNSVLVNDEKRQNTLPQNKLNYKIPVVCNLPEIQVENINLTELLKIDGLWK